jgi:hypothetical protein
MRAISEVGRARSSVGLETLQLPARDADTDRQVTLAQARRTIFVAKYSVIGAGHGASL